jgi:hypothetical protein
MDLRRMLSMTVVGVSLASGSLAQERSGSTEEWLAPGARVRMTVEGSRFEGYVSSRSGDTLRLALPGQNPLAPDVSVPLSAASRLELHVGQKRHTKTGAIIGAMVFGLVGIWEPVSSAPGCGQGTAPSCSRAEAVIGGFVGGAAVGALVGRVIKTDQWSPVTREMLASVPPSPEDLRSAPGASRVPVGRAIPAGVSVRF